MTSPLRSQATGSSTERWMNCPSSVAMSAKLPPEPEKRYTSEGSKAHALAASLLKGEIHRDSVTDEAVLFYVDTIRHYAGSAELHVEERLDLLGSSGGLDCYCIKNKTHGYVFDFKYGVGVKLDAVENWQLAFYAVALKEKYPQLSKIMCVLIQPRVAGMFEETSHFSTWTLSYQKLKVYRALIEDGLRQVEEGGRLKAGKWCRFCRAKSVCPAFLLKAETAAEISKGESNLPVVTDSWLPGMIPRVAKALKMKKAVNSWFDKAEEFLFQQLEAGKPVPGWEVGTKRSYRKWKCEDGSMTVAEIATALVSRGINEPLTPELMPLTAAEKICNVDDLVFKPEGGKCLKPTKEWLE